jgi:hypothetical protein
VAWAGKSIARFAFSSLARRLWLTLVVSQLSDIQAWHENGHFRKLFALTALLCSVGLMSLTQAEGSGGQIIGPSMTNAQMRLLFSSTDGYSYQVQGNASLNSRFWNDALPAVGATGNWTSVLAPASGSVGFFRVLEFTNRTFWYDWGYYYETPFLNIWGMGSVQKSYVHADRAYDWYIDQADTGDYSSENCGPASVTMAIKWYDQSFNKTAEDARNTYPEGGQGWPTYDIINYLNLYSIPNTTSHFTGTNQLMGVLDQSNLVIVCLQTAYLTQNDVSEQRVGKFYGWSNTHFIVVKGYRVVDTNVFFEVYDPWDYHAVYADGSPKGRNRHQLASELNNAIAHGWNFLVVIPPPGAEGAGAAANVWLQPVDPKYIIHIRSMQ